jgi:hypothetical protein
MKTFFCILLVPALVAAAAEPVVSTVTVNNLRCEYRQDPLGILPLIAM